MSLTVGDMFLHYENRHGSLFEVNHTYMLLNTLYKTKCVSPQLRTAPRCKSQGIR